MKKFILAPDSFKGTLSSLEITEILKNVLYNKFPNATIYELPITDGGENSINVFHKIIGGDIFIKKVTGPNFQKVDAKYLIKDQMAIIEMAECVGLHLCNKIDCKITTTYGIGELISECIEKGIKNIIICIGGSSTNDGGIGLLSALGFKFFNKDGKNFIPTGITLNQIVEIIKPPLENFNDISFTLLSDVKNLLLGLNGATNVYAPQKGASKKDVSDLEDNMIYLTKLFNNGYENDESSGAGGGIVYGLKSMFNVNIKSGIEYILEIAEFENLLQNCDYVITGEGKIDSQTKNGKVIYGICKYAKKYNIKVLALAGIIDDDIHDLFDLGLTSAISINQGILTFEEAKKNARKNLETTFRNIVGLLS